MAPSVLKKPIELCFNPTTDELKVLMSIMDTSGKGFVSQADLLRIAATKD